MQLPSVVLTTNMWGTRPWKLESWTTDVELHQLTHDECISQQKKSIKRPVCCLNLNWHQMPEGLNNASYKRTCITLRFYPITKSKDWLSFSFHNKINVYIYGYRMLLELMGFDSEFPILNAGVARPKCRVGVWYHFIEIHINSIIYLYLNSFKSGSVPRCCSGWQLWCWALWYFCLFLIFVQFSALWLNSEGRNCWTFDSSLRFSLCSALSSFFI